MKKRIEPPRTVGLVANPEKPGCLPAVRAAEKLARRAGLRMVTDPATRALTGLRARVLPDSRSVSNACDLLLVFGGDGTILRLARETAGCKTPFLGINVGNLGFLTAAAARQLPQLLPRIFREGGAVQRRALIQATIQGANPSPPQLALNDFVVARRAATRMVELDVSVDGQVLTRYRGDGLIISSPTGSTAYSLAAGGPIVSPEAPVFALTPISPHTLSNRPLILSLKSTLQIRVLPSRVSVELAADGQVQTELVPGDQVAIRQSRHTLNLLWPDGLSFFETLQQKLRWSGSSV